MVVRDRVPCYVSDGFVRGVQEECQSTGSTDVSLVVRDGVVCHADHGGGTVQEVEQTAACNRRGVIRYRVADHREVRVYAGVFGIDQASSIVSRVA